MLIKIGDRVEIIIAEGNFQGEYPSQVINVDGQDLTLAIPVFRGHLVPVRPGIDLVVKILKPDAIYQFETVIVRRSDDDRTNGFIIPLPKKMVRKQRRSDVRVEVCLPVEVWVFDSPQKERWKTVSARTIDLSAGGTRIESAEEFTANFPLEINLLLPGDEPIHLICRYIRGGRLSGRGKYWTALRFEAIKERDKRRILQFVFQKQQDLRAKGLI